MTITSYFSDKSQKMAPIFWEIKTMSAGILKVTFIRSRTNAEE